MWGHHSKDKDPVIHRAREEAENTQRTSCDRSSCINFCHNFMNAICFKHTVTTIFSNSSIGEYINFSTNTIFASGCSMNACTTRIGSRTGCIHVRTKSISGFRRTSQVRLAGIVWHITSLFDKLVCAFCWRWNNRWWWVCVCMCVRTHTHSKYDSGSLSWLINGEKPTHETDPKKEARLTWMRSSVTTSRNTSTTIQNPLYG